ncbi:serine/threonine protein phosphatase PrpC [Actinoplanes octamycinicus]|uniref:Serine/threonine protein phosphatase PrpC n=1 Tax=Actinoplanes octamycinicus TaxID=135948 RepID=A0A7W7H646_9ACTN|nr:protein phosphatase 2C domain-containing protein [Actinoplanes octamycinicus]MBB4744593.1 serine/threonine protein phosphatase PrpC [Actinoplanes octamycinicus]GIE63824.1 protein phosphatase [Actinoplanes octamycinicus]
MIGEAVWRFGGRVVTAAAGSVTGHRYDRNYDVLHLDADRPLAIVADGMGAGEGSAAAGRIAVETFATRFAGPDPAALRAAVQEAHSRVRQKARTLRDLTGCTLTALAGVPGDDAAARIVQLGDSRAYRLRAGLLELLTVDHTIAWLGLTHGWYAATDPRAEADGYRLTRYTGHPDQPDPDILDVPLHPGDRLLLCTDGVSGQLSYQQLAHVMAAVPPRTVVQSLLDATLQAGGHDNATAVALTVT